MTDAACIVHSCGTAIRYPPRSCKHLACVHCVYTRQQSYNFGASTVPRYRLNARCMATPCSGSSASSSGFSTCMFLRSQICPICENLMTFLKVPGRFSTSWNSESLRKLQPYTIMGTLPSITPVADQYKGPARGAAGNSEGVPRNNRDFPYKKIT